MKQLIPKLLNCSFSLLFILSFLLSSLGWGQAVEVSYGCGDTWYDPGGPAASYGINNHYVYTVCPDNPGDYVTVSFTNVQLLTTSYTGGNSYADHIIVLNGASTTSPAIGDIMGTSNQSFTSSASDGCLTFIFMSNDIHNGAGWQATNTCSNTPGSNSTVCSSDNCLGNCMEVICGTDDYNWISDGQGIEELNAGNRGCLGTLGERCSRWFLLNPVIPGDIAMNLTVNGGQDQDFAVWSGFRPSLDCPAMTGAAPIRCNFAGMNNTGSGTGFVTAINDAWHDDNLVVSQTDIDNGIYFMVLVDTYNNGCADPVVNMSFAGTTPGILSCDPIPLPTTIINLSGFKEEEYNLIFWETMSERNLSHFIIEKSHDGSFWTEIGLLGSSENSTDKNSYYFRDFDEDDLAYYRIKSVDFDGHTELSYVVSIESDLRDGDWIVLTSNNPAENNFTFQYTSKNYEDDVHFSIFDMLGRQIKTDKTLFSSEKLSYTIPVSELKAGLYKVNISQNSNVSQITISILK